MKKCKQCCLDKPLIDFAKNSFAKDGYRNFCKSCVNENTIKSGYKRQNNKKLPVRYRYSKNQAKRKSKTWDISTEQYEILIANPCFYCGGALAETGVGLDRIDSKKGYVLDNVKPCCRICNVMKNAMSVDDFYKHMEKILNNRSGSNV